MSPGGIDRAGGAPRVAWLELLILLALSAVVVYVRARLAPVPFERDEGEYAYAGQLILAGVAPYAEAYNMKMPGVYFAYAALIGLFGDTHTAIHIGLLVLNALTAATVFALGRAVAGTSEGLLAAAFFLVLSLSPEVTGAFANAEHFVLPFGALGIAAAWVAMRRGDWRWSAGAGVLLGTAFLMKQHGIAYLGLAGVLGAIWCLETRRWKDGARLALALGAGSALPLGVLMLYMALAGSFERFVFWTFSYARAYVSLIPLHEAPVIFWLNFKPVLLALWPIWLLALLGALAAAAFGRGVLRRTFPLLAVLFGMLATVPGFYFRNHYFLLPLPLIAVVAALGVGQAALVFGERQRQLGAAFLAAAVILMAGIQHRDYLFRMSPDTVARATYGLNPFPESLPVADYLRQRTQPGDRILVLGSEPQIYFYSQRRSATGYVYMYPLMEPQPFARSMQQEMIAEVQARDPKYVVLVNVATSWLIQDRSERLMFEWANRYLEERYAVDGLVEMQMRGAAYTWGSTARQRVPRTENWMKIYRRIGPSD